MIIIKGRKGLKIYFDCENPEHYLDDISLYGMSDKEVKKAKKRPFITIADIPIRIEWKKSIYEFVIPKGYTWNGANVPPFAWLLIGQRTDPRFKFASCVHDYLCENHKLINHDRYLSTLIFETLCEQFGRFNDFKRWLMFHSVDNFQKMFGKDLEGSKW